MKGAARSTGPDEVSTARATGGSEEARNEARPVERAGAFWLLLTEMLSGERVGVFEVFVLALSPTSHAGIPK